MPPRHRRRADDPRSGRLARAEVGQRHAADADRGREHGLHVRRRQGEGPAHDAVLRDLRQPRHLPRRLAGRHGPQGRLGRQAAASVPRRTSGNSTTSHEDFSPANDLAAKNPEKLKELQALFLKEAVKYHVLPLDDRIVERINAALVGRPDLMDGRTSLTRLRGHDRDDGERLHQHQEPVAHDHRRGRRFPKGGANGVILSQAGRFGGWSLYVKDGKPMYTYNWLGLKRYTVAVAQAAARRQGDDPLRVHLRRRRPGQGRHGHDLRQRREGRRREDRAARRPTSSRPTKGGRGRGRRDAR